MTSVIDVVRGPAWENVEIKDLQRIVSNRHGATQIVVVTLADGRELMSNSKVVQLTPGPARLLVLRATANVLQTEAVAASER